MSEKKIKNNLNEYEDNNFENKQSEAKRKLRPPDIAEAVFDVGYLVFDIVAAVLFFVFSQGRTLFILYGVLTLILCGGDAFHLIPRVKKALRGLDDKTKHEMSFGLQVSSITMTVFYILLMYIWKYTFPELSAPIAVEIIIWITAVIRIVICLLPQNDWYGTGNMKFSLARNLVFLVTGIGVIVLYAISGNAQGYGMYRMIIAIVISFGCYFPVTVLSKKKPMIGMLMIPKTCAYIWMIAMGLQLL